VNRSERKALASEMRKQATAWPAQLAPVPESEWPARQDGARPLAAWRSRRYLALIYAAPALGGVEVRRLTVNRVTIDASGHWDQDIPWEDLQRCKRETGHGDWYAVEVYPRDRDIVHVANMRHLWLLAEPLGIGWVAENPASPT
jgi:hypothetical protein